MRTAGLVGRVGAYAMYVLLGVAAGQLVAWLVGAAAAFANVTNIIAAFFGEAAAMGAIFLVGSTAYAFVVGFAVSSATSALAGKSGPDHAEALTGFLAGVLAFLLVTLLAEPYVYFVINALPALAEYVGESSGFGQFVAAVGMHAVPVAILAGVVYLPIRAVFYSPTGIDPEP